ncbi:MAG: hypothetical protein AB7F79_13130 [Steroidobacteraceae bacterium]
MNRILQTTFSKIALSLLVVVPVTVWATPDWRGYWVRATDPDNPASNISSRMDPKDVPAYTPEYAEKWKVIWESFQAGSLEYDPGAHCLSWGVPYNMTIPYSGEIEMRPGQVTIITEFAGDTRRIYTDGRGHPEDFDPSRQGHSIGKWVGNTLVVDTVGIVENTQLNGILSPHSDQLHVTEWFREYKPGYLEIRYRLEDPKAFTKPYEYKLTWMRSPDKFHEIAEYICTNNRDREQTIPSTATK